MNKEYLNPFIRSMEELFPSRFGCNADIKLNDQSADGNLAGDVAIVINIEGAAMGSFCLRMTRDTAESIAKKLTGADLSGDDKKLSRSIGLFSELYALGVRDLMHESVNIDISPSVPQVALHSGPVNPPHDDWIRFDVNSDLGGFGLLVSLDVGVAQQMDREIRALVADDSALMRKMVKDALKQAGITNVEEAVDGKDALKKATESRFDILLLDWHMPEMDGVDVLKTLRQYGDKTPVVMVSSESKDDNLMKAFDLGADNYILKPFKPGALMTVIRDVFSGDSPEARAERSLSGESEA